MSVWYFNKNLKPQGPLSFEEMKRKIIRGEINPFELIFKEGEKDWLPAMEWKEFPREFFPAFQKNLFRGMNPDEKEWTLLTRKPGAENPVQEGPYSLKEVRALIEAHEASVEDYIWRTGLTGWLQIKFGPPDARPSSERVKEPAKDERAKGERANGEPPKSGAEI